MLRRVGRPGLVGMAARTAVVAGTATAVSGNVARRQNDRASADAAEHQQEAAAAPPPPAPPPPAAASSDVVAQLQQLAELKSQGLLSDEQFESAKAKLLG